MPNQAPTLRSLPAMGDKRYGAMRFPAIPKKSAEIKIAIKAWRDTRDNQPTIYAMPDQDTRALVRFQIGEDAATLALPGLSVEVIHEDEIDPIDDRMDPGAIQWVKDQIDRGNEWAWCTAQVRVTWLGWVGESTWLGHCSYASEADFRQPGGYYDDLLREALSDLREKIAAGRTLLDSLKGA